MLCRLCRCDGIGLCECRRFKIGGGAYACRVHLEIVHLHDVVTNKTKRVDFFCYEFAPFQAAGRKRNGVVPSTISVKSSKKPQVGTRLYPTRHSDSVPWKMSH